MRKLSTIIGLTFASLGLAIVLFTLHMLINCVYVYEGHSLMLQYKGPVLFGSSVSATPGHFAQGREAGVLEDLRGPGRHFYCPLWWKWKITPDVVVQPGEVALFTSNMGDAPPNGQFIVDGDISGPTRAKFKGVLRKVYGPGRYRVHPYAFEAKIIKTIEERNSNGKEVKVSGWVDVPTGYVGVVTRLAPDAEGKKKPGVQDEVLPPGLYPVNPREEQVDIVEVGYRESSISVSKIMLPNGQEKVDESGEPEARQGTGISFPSNDGFPVQIDFTAIWGILPKHAPNIIKTFGTIDEVERKVIQPQSNSICRNYGSTMGAPELLVGETRQKFQDEVTEELSTVLKTKELSLLYGLVRHIYIPKEVRIPLQKGYMADELKLTRDEEITTKQAEGQLREAEKLVLQEAEKVRAETTKMVAAVMAEGEKEIGSIEAETKQKVAAIDKEIAILEAKKTEAIGKAKAAAEQLLNEAKAQKFELAVKAFGSPDAYNKWQFAEGLPENINLQLFYAGQGTLWTDLKGIQPTITIPAANPPAVKPGTVPKK